MHFALVRFAGQSGTRTRLFLPPRPRPFVPLTDPTNTIHEHGFSPFQEHVFSATNTASLFFLAEPPNWINILGRRCREVRIELILHPFAFILWM
jgi:hypothetical protein